MLNIKMVLLCGVLFIQQSVLSFANQEECYDLNRDLLATIISEPENNAEYLFFVESAGENNELLSLIKQNPDGSEEYIDGERLLSEEIVLSKSDDHDALILKSQEGFSLQEGGVLELKYLYNGITQSYRSIFLRISLRGSTWILETEDGTVVERMYLVSRTIFGRLIGIKRIDINERIIDPAEDDEDGFMQQDPFSS
jgi:hypothetical protein